MCGIAGLYNLKQVPIDPALLGRMCDRLKHRGPDDEGYVFFSADRTFAAGGEDTPPSVYSSKLNYSPILPRERVEKAFSLGLAHRRLSIIDLSSAGHQPMCTEDQKVWIVFNGEIYNYLEIRSELKALGHAFSTNTDTEVLLKAYLQWGFDCLAKLNGMWAFVLYDQRKNLLFGCRDRFGVKPLYYYQDNEYFAFASEIKALTIPPFKKEINDSAAYSYLVRQMDEWGKETLFKDISELEPAHYFIFDLSAKRFNLYRYFSLSFNPAWESFDPAKAVEHVGLTKEHVFQAIKLRLRSDVPIGSCLSGGIDSSAIVCALAEINKPLALKQVGSQLRAFTACFENSALDESRWAELVVKKTGARWIRSFARSDQLLADIEELAFYHDLPVGSTSIYAQYYLMKAVKENGVKVVIDGQGGDELFAGYPMFYIPFFVEMLKNGDLFSFRREFSALGHAPISRQLILKNLLKSFIFDRFPSAARFSTARFWDLYNDQFVSAQQRIELSLNQGSQFASLNSMLNHYLAAFNLRTLLRYEDRNSMRFSIEARTPFVDDLPLTEHCFSVPGSYKIHNGWSKYLLRQAMNGILPNEIAARPDKLGFQPPEVLWLNEAKAELKSYITPDLARFIKVKELLARWDENFSRMAVNGPSRMWRIINFAVWKKVFQLN